MNETFKAIDEFFKRLEYKEIEGVSFLRHNCVLMFSSGNLTMLSEMYVTNENGDIYEISSPQGVWHFVQTINHEIINYEMEHALLVLTLDNGCKIKADTMLQPAGDNLYLSINDRPSDFI